MRAWLLLAAPALAGPETPSKPSLPADNLRPVAASLDAPARYATWRTGQGLPPSALVCDPLWPDIALLCFRVWDNGQRRWVSAEDTARWQVDARALRATLRERAPAHLSSAERVPIEGMSASYLRLVDGDGWAAAGALRPELLVEKVGGLPLRLAMPAESVLVAWKGGDPEVDRVMAVGVKEMHDQLQGSVSPRIVSWDGAKFVPYGQAVPKPPSPPASPAPAPRGPAPLGP